MNAADQQRPFDTDEWAGDAGKRWLANLDSLEKMIEPIGQALIERAQFKAGETVVDIGCGGGWTSRQIAQQTSPDGHVLGLDISADLIHIATQRAAQAGLSNLSFNTGDAASVMPDHAPFDRLFSRFGCMFFPDPYQAFSNLRQMLKPGGRLDIAVWAPVTQNPWVWQMMVIAKNHVTLPKPIPRAPGPFALGEEAYILDILNHAGFHTPNITAYSSQQYIGGPGNTPEQAAQFVMDSMHVGDIFRESPKQLRATVTAELVALFSEHNTPQGVALGSKALFVNATA